MSQEDARSFLERVANDPEVRRLVSAAAQARDAERLVAIGAQHDLRFSTRELDEAVNEQHFGRGARELSDSQLEGVAGGFWFWGWFKSKGVDGESTDSKHEDWIE